MLILDTKQSKLKRVFEFETENKILSETESKIIGILSNNKEISCRNLAATVYQEDIYDEGNEQCIRVHINNLRGKGFNIDNIHRKRIYFKRYYLYNLRRKEKI